MDRFLRDRMGGLGACKFVGGCGKSTRREVLDGAEGRNRLHQMIDSGIN